VLALAGFLAWASPVDADDRLSRPASPATHEVVPDPTRPFFYRVRPQGNSLEYLDGSTGLSVDYVVVGPSPSSIDFSDDENFLLIAVSGANQIAIVDIDARSVVRTLDLTFSPLSVRDGRPDRLYASGAGDGIVRVVNESTGAVVTSWNPLGNVEALLDVSPDGSELLVHLRSNPVKLYRYSIAADDPVLLATDNHDLQGSPEDVIVRWPSRSIYLSSTYPNGIKEIDLDTLRGIRDFWTYAYPEGIALLANQGLVFGINSNPYDSSLWAFDLATGTLLRRVPIDPELQFVAASEPAETVIVWTSSRVLAFPLAPSVAPVDPWPGAYVAYYPGIVEAYVWTGIPETTIDHATITVNGRELPTYFETSDRLLGSAWPLVEVGTWNVIAEISWAGGTSSVAWMFTVDPPPPHAVFQVRPSNPIYSGQTVRFDGSNSLGAAGTIVAYEWDFGDNSTAVGMHVEHVYGQPGEYVAQLRIRTDIGQADLTSWTLIVWPAPEVDFVPYEHASGFRVPVSSSWSLTEDQRAGGAVLELAVRAPGDDGTGASVIVDTRADRAAEETDSYIEGLSETVLMERRNQWPALEVIGPYAARTIAGRPGGVLTIFDPSTSLTQRIAIVVSEPHDRFWLLVFTSRADYFEVHEPTFETMLDGFEITLPPRSPPSDAVTYGLAAVSLASATGVAVALVFVLRRGGGAWKAGRGRAFRP